jgi:hypothetical protein
MPEYEYPQQFLIDYFIAVHKVVVANALRQRFAKRSEANPLHTGLDGFFRFQQASPLASIQ